MPLEISLGSTFLHVLVLYNILFSSDGGTPTQTVASVNRSNQPARRKGTVRLTPSQVAISKKLGVPLSEYAKYVKE